MEDKIIIIATLKLLNNRLPQLKKVVQELQAHCIQTEPDMLQYDWFISENSDTIKVIETYKNSEAVLFHFDNHKSFSSQLSESRTFVQMELFGNVSLALRERVKKISPQHFSSIATLNKI